MKEKKAREDYSSNYEFMRENLWKEVKEYDEDNFPLVISYFNKRKDGVEVSGKVQQIKPVEYKATMNITEAFKLLKEAMHTKGGVLRKSMESLKPYEEYMLISLINYLREEWVGGNREMVDLTWSEFFFLKEGGFKKQKKTK